MAAIIVDGKICEDRWTLYLETPAGQPDPRAIIPLTAWLELRDAVADRADLGVWLDSDEEVEQIAADLRRIAVVALHFPAFNDGRPYSTAHLLRRRYGYEGEIRAFGDVRRDELEQMHRCGFNAYVPRADDTAEALLEGLKLFSHSYQSSIDRPEPLFRTRRS